MENKTAKPPPVEIRTGVAARLLGISPRMVRYMCEAGLFRSAHKPGFGRNANWMMIRHEVILRKYNPNQNKDPQLY